MIFLYTINNIDVLLLSRPHHSWFVMKQLSLPPSRQSPWEHQFGPPPTHPTLHSHHPPVPLNKFARNPSGLRWDEQIMLANPRERGHWSYESQLSYEKHSGGVLWLPDEQQRCMFMLLPGADCRIGMQGAQDAKRPNGQCSWQNNTLTDKEKKFTIQALQWL